MLSLTDKAAHRFLQIRHESNRRGTALRVAVLGGDCSGLKYFIGLDDFRAANDLCVISRGIDIYVDGLSAPYIWGSLIDWVEVNNDAGFVVYNPNSGRSHGGCSNHQNGQGCMTLGDGKHCIKNKDSTCFCNVDSTEIVYLIK